MRRLAVQPCKVLRRLSLVPLWLLFGGCAAPLPAPPSPPPTVLEKQQQDKRNAAELMCLSDVGEGFEYCVDQVLATGVVPNDNPGRALAAKRGADEVLTKCPNLDSTRFVTCAAKLISSMPSILQDATISLVKAGLYARVEMQRVKAAAARAEDEFCRKAGVQLGEKRVRIGLSADEILRCGWGKPIEVQRTTIGSGTRELWIYGPKSYLYLDNDRLTIIQN